MSDSSMVLPGTVQATQPGGAVEVAGPEQAPPPGRRRRRAGGSGKDAGRARFLLGCLVPAFVLYLVFMVWPTVNVFRLSLYDWSGFSADPTFTGLSNFRLLVDDPQFLRAFQNTVLLLVVVTVVTMGLALLLAAVMTRQDLPGRDFFRFVLYIPSVLSIVVVAAIFSAIYDQRDGLINGSLDAVGLGENAPVWLGNQQLVIFSVGIAMVWQSLGYYLVLYMASMSGVPKELYEASSLDGAGPVSQFFHVTLPLVWQSLRTSLTFFIISSVNLSFVLVRAMTGGGPDGSSEVLLSYMYQQAYTNSTYGYGMAIGVVIFVFSFALALVVHRVTKREVVQF